MKDAAGFALMLITWARGGQLGRRGKGYQVALQFLHEPSSSPAMLLAMYAIRCCNLACKQDRMVLLQAVLEFPLACGISTGTPVRVCFAVAAAHLWAFTASLFMSKRVLSCVHVPDCMLILSLHLSWRCY